MGLRPVITHWDPLYVLHFPTSQVDFGAGDMLTLESGLATLMDAVSESTDFIGIAGGTEDNSTVPVYLRCRVKMNLVSASYDFGDGLKYFARETLTDDADANTIGHFFEFTTTTDFGLVLFDVPELYNNNWDIISV